MRRALLLGPLLCAVLSLGACGSPDDPSIRLATTTSTANSGLLDELLGAFTEETGIRVRPIVVGTGRALAFGRGGDADLLLVHAQKLEEEFLREGHASERRDVMYNDFVIVGPGSDPARIRGIQDPAVALARIAAAGAGFASRGDGSGTHVREQALWRQAAVDPTSNPAYKEVGSGMAGCLTYADEKRTYVLTDRGTYLAVRKRRDLELEVLVENHVGLRNPYGVLLVSAKRHPGVNETDARRLMEWLTSEAGQRRIAAFRVDGQPLFHPNATR